MLDSVQLILTSTSMQLILTSTSMQLGKPNCSEQKMMAYALWACQI